MATQTSGLNTKLLNCYADLNRAAVSLKLVPKGKGYNIFVDHALKILHTIELKRAKRFEKEIEIEMGRYHRKEITPDRVADKFLTIGLLLKP